MNDKELAIVVNAKDRASATLRKMGAKIDKVNEKAVEAAKKITKIGATAALALGGAALNAAAKFEQQMADVSTLISGDSTKAVAQFSDGIKEMMERVPKSADELGASAYAIVSAGFSDATEALNVLENASKLATAGLGTVEEATTLTTVAMNAFNIPAEEADKAIDVLFKTVKNGITNVSQLSQAFGKMAGNAVAAGVKFEDVQAATAALSATTGKTSESQNALAQAFVELTVTGGKLDKSLEDNGSSLEQLNKMIGEKGLVGGFEEVRNQLGLSDTQFKNMFSSAEAGTAVFQLLTSANETYNVTLNDMITGSNSVNEAFEKQSKTFSNQWQIVKNKLNRALINFGTKIMPHVIVLIQKAENAAKNLSHWWDSLSDGTKNLIKYAGIFTATMIPMIVVASKVISIAKGLAGVFGLVGGGATAAGAAVTAFTSPLGLAAIAAGALVFVGKKVVDNMNKQKEAQELLASKTVSLSSQLQFLSAEEKRLSDNAFTASGALDVLTMSEEVNKMATENLDRAKENLKLKQDRLKQSTDEVKAAFERERDIQRELIELQNGSTSPSTEELDRKKRELKQATNSLEDAMWLEFEANLQVTKANSELKIALDKTKEAKQNLHFWSEKVYGSAENIARLFNPNGTLSKNVNSFSLGAATTLEGSLRGITNKLGDLSGKVANFNGQLSVLPGQTRQYLQQSESAINNFNSRIQSGSIGDFNINQLRGRIGLHTGGIVGGRAGRDVIPANLTSGEMVLNKSQQSKLFSMISEGGGSHSNSVTINGDIILKDQSAVDRFFKRLDRTNQLSGLGVR